MTAKTKKTLLGNPVPDGEPMPEEGGKPVQHIDRKAMQVRKNILLGNNADYSDEELQEIHELWTSVFQKRGTKDAEAEAKFVTRGCWSPDGTETNPLLQARMQMWARTEWSPNMPQDLRVQVKDFQGECEGIASMLKNRGIFWLNEYREWIKKNPRLNVYQKMNNQALPMNMAMNFLSRQELAMIEHPEIAGDTCLQQLLRVMRGGKTVMENTLKTFLNLDVSQFEKTEWYELCTPAGTYDLRTGKLIREDNGMTLTVTPAAPDMDPSHFEKSAWKELLEEDLPEKEKRDYLQMAIGFSLYGELEYGQDPILHIWQGEAGAGKSQIFNDITRALGLRNPAHSASAYAGNMDIRVFTTNMDEMRRQHEKALMFGKRLITLNELGQDMWLSPETLKGMVSTVLIHAEEKYKKPFDFTNNCSFHMVSNYMPQIKNVDDLAVQRRIRVCHFWKTFTNPDGSPNENVKDPALPGRAKKELGIILGWAMEGARKFAEANYRLIAPPSILKETREYFDSCDWFSAFLRDECEITADTANELTPLSAVYLRFSKWCDVTGRKLYGMDSPRFGKRLRSWNKDKDGHPLTVFTVGHSKTVSVLGLKLKGNTEAAFLAQKQVYGQDNAPQVSEATAEEVKEAEEEKKSNPALTGDALMDGFDMKEIGQIIDAQISVKRQEEIAKQALTADTPEKAIMSGVAQRVPDILDRLRTLLSYPAGTPLMPDDEALIVLAWNSMATVKEKRDRKCRQK